MHTLNRKNEWYLECTPWTKKMNDILNAHFEPTKMNDIVNAHHEPKNKWYSECTPWTKKMNDIVKAQYIYMQVNYYITTRLFLLSLI